jgi:glucosamine--fructose-6-phosphate aminotransferase (isomerizing)
VANTLRGHLLEEEGNSWVRGLNLGDDLIKSFNRVVITACGTSWHSALIGEYMIEEIGRLPVEVEYASEFRYRNPVLDERTLVIAISQSGETADTLAAVREAKRRGARAVGLVNVVGSTIAREVSGGLYLHAGPEVGVASTKAFTSQVAALALVALRIARLRNLSIIQGREFVQALQQLPAKIQQVLDRASEVEKLATMFEGVHNALYLGRGVNFPVALEGALKLKEISYIHAEGYPAAEMKHGPIALIDANMPVVVVAPRDAVHPKIVSNVEEVKARGGRVIALISEGDKEIERLADATFVIPTTHDLLSPILTSVPLQLLAYHVAVARGCNVDQPRNLAKSVTVEWRRRRAKESWSPFALPRLRLAPIRAACTPPPSRSPAALAATDPAPACGGAGSCTPAGSGSETARRVPRPRAAARLGCALARHDGRARPGGETPLR